MNIQDPVRYKENIHKNVEIKYIVKTNILHQVRSIIKTFKWTSQTGLMQIWKQKQWPKQNFCAGSLIKEAKPIKWIDIQTAFYLIGIGTIFGVFILGSEFIFSKCRSKKNSKCNTSFCNKVSE
jgi:hypothetical protein